MNTLIEFVEQLASFIGEGPNAIYVAWVIAILGILALLWLLHTLIHWYFKTNQILANQEHIIELLDMRMQAAPSKALTTSATSSFNPSTGVNPNMAVPRPVRQHPIDDEFSEILNVRPHNLGDQRTDRTQPVLQPVTNLPSLQPAKSDWSPPTPPSMQSPPMQSPPMQSPPMQPSPSQQQAAPLRPAQRQPSQQPPQMQPPQMQPSNSIPPPASMRPNAMDSSGVDPNNLMRENDAIQAKPANTSVTMLGSAEQRAERQMEAQEAMRLAEEAARSTRSKTADIPDIPTSLVRTYTTSKTNPLTGRRNRNRD